MTEAQRAAAVQVLLLVNRLDNQITVGAETQTTLFQIVGEAEHLARMVLNTQRDDANAARDKLWDVEAERQAYLDDYPTGPGNLPMGARQGQTMAHYGGDPYDNPGCDAGMWEH